MLWHNVFFILTCFANVTWYQTWYFYYENLFYNTHRVRYYNFSITDIIVESLNLMKMPKQKIISPWSRKHTYQNTEQKEGVLTKTRNDLKPPEISWKHLKPPRNNLKPPETSHIIVNLSPESCLYFQGFRDSKLLNGCLVVWPSNLRLQGMQ